MKSVDQRTYLREWRLAKGLNQPELAQRANTSKSEVSRLEKGARRMTISWMNRFATAMGISIDDLMTVPPIGFGAVSPAPPAQEVSPKFTMASLGEITIGIKKDGHHFVTVSGDDWAGTFTPGDILIYDTSKRSPIVPGLFALSAGGEIIVRRVTPTEKGHTLTCSNQSYPPMPLVGMEIVGRIVARAQRL